MAFKWLKLRIIHSQGHDKAAVTSVSEFATPSSFLSLSVVEAGVQRVKDEHQGRNSIDI